MDARTMAEAALRRLWPSYDADGFVNVNRAFAEQVIESAGAVEMFEALRPFAELCETGPDAHRHGGDSTCEWRILASDLRSARAALAKAGQK